MNASSFDYDLIVIGGGSGGVRAARLTSQSGLRVALCEEKQLGGTCVNRGCIPKKILHSAAHTSHSLQHLEPQGFTLSSYQFHWETLRDNIHAYIHNLNHLYESILNKAGVTLLSGTASFLDNHTLSVAGTTVSAEKILIATGGTPFKPSLPGAELAIVSDDVFSFPSLPPSLIIVGGSYIAVELASIFHGLGVKTTLVHRRSHLLSPSSPIASQHLLESLHLHGLETLLSQEISSISQEKNNLLVTFKDGLTRNASQLLFATGRTPNLKNLNLENLSPFHPESFFVGKKIRVNHDNFQTSLPHIYAIGDAVHGFPELTPVAIRQAMIFHAHITHTPPPPLHPHLIPTVVFSIPPLAFVGLHETQAHEYAQQHKLKLFVRKASFKPMDTGFSGLPHTNLYCFFTAGFDEKILGISLVGEGVDELIQPLAVAISLQPTFSQFQNTIAVHPTASEELITAPIVAQFDYDQN